jgi:hypothetical protein
MTHVVCNVFLDFTDRCEQEGLCHEMSLPTVPQIGWQIDNTLDDKDFCFWKFKVQKMELSPISITVYATLNEDDSTGPGDMRDLSELGVRELMRRVDLFVNSAKEEGWSS